MDTYKNCRLTPVEEQCCDNCYYMCNSSYKEGSRPKCWEPYSGNPFMECPCKCTSLEQFIDQGGIFSKCVGCEYYEQLINQKGE